jgi:DNA-binding HxlR family transcriptional regulator
MSSQAWQTGFMGTAKQGVLEALETKGPLTLPEIPRAWPVTRQLLEFLMDHLVEAGFVEAGAGSGIPGKHAYRLTDLGSAYLRSRPVEEMNTIQFYSRPVTASRSRAAS